MTDEERQELETLRAEKLAREQTARATAALAEAGVSAGFAALLTGRDDADTDARVAEFCEAYRASLSSDISARLPDRAPTLASPPPARVERGVKRLL